LAPTGRIQAPACAIACYNSFYQWLAGAGLAVPLRASKGWIWTMTGGVVSIALRVVIIVEWPVSALWVIGLFVAIEAIAARTASATSRQAGGEVRRDAASLVAII
jgi:uncharacterized membrane protein HdeD (DUF308 family)